jgi:hypothetical protein
VMTKQVEVSCRVVSFVWGGGQGRARCWGGPDWWFIQGQVPKEQKQCHQQPGCSWCQQRTALLCCSCCVHGMCTHLRKCRSSAPAQGPTGQQPAS